MVTAQNIIDTCDYNWTKPNYQKLFDDVKKQTEKNEEKERVSIPEKHRYFN